MPIRILLLLLLSEFSTQFFGSLFCFNWFFSLFLSLLTFAFSRSIHSSIYVFTWHQIEKMRKSQIIMIIINWYIFTHRETTHTLSSTTVERVSSKSAVLSTFNNRARHLTSPHSPPRYNNNRVTSDRKSTTTTITKLYYYRSVRIDYYSFNNLIKKKKKERIQFVNFFCCFCLNFCLYFFARLVRSVFWS